MMKDWEPTVYDCEDDVPGSAVSTCCGAPEAEAPLGICTTCHEHCDWYDEFEEEPEEETTEFSRWWAENKGNQGDPFGYDRRRCEECWDMAFVRGKTAAFREATQMVRDSSE